MAFGADIMEWASDSQQWSSAECAETVRAIYKRIVMYSPNQYVGKYSQGHFNKNWRLGETKQIGEIEGTVTPQQKYTEIDMFVDDDYFLNHPSGQVTMTNSTEYITEIEYKGWVKRNGSPGHPAYAPVATALAEFVGVGR